jgi:glycosyltransferase involved in cell wall biosynthesis
MKILIANKYFFRKGGAESVMLTERDFLMRANVDVVDFSMQDERNLPSPYSQRFVANQAYDDEALRSGNRLRMAAKLIHSPEAVRGIGRLIDATRPDLVHCHNIYHQLTPSIIGAAKRRGVPVVLTLHDYKPVCPVHTRLKHGQPCSDCLGGRISNVVRHRCAGGSLARSVLLYTEARAHRLLQSYERVDAVIAPSEFMRASVTESRFPASRVRVIYNGVDTNRLRPTREDDGYALYLGRLSPEKGVESLLATHETVADAVPLHIAGTGPLEGVLRSRYPKARFLGHLNGAALEDATRRAAVIVLPSICYENCPISILEAMSHAKAVVAADIGGIPELVVHRETGLLYPPGDRLALAACLTELLAAPALRARYGAAARRRAEQRFSIDQHHSELMQLYNELLQNEQARRPRTAEEPIARMQSIAAEKAAADPMGRSG